MRRPAKCARTNSNTAALARAPSEQRKQEGGAEPSDAGEASARTERTRRVSGRVDRTTSCRLAAILATMRAVPIAAATVLGMLLAGPASGAPQLRSAAGGTVRALVVGIDDYATARPKLRGAVGDARDLAATLRGAGVADLRTLFDREATRPAFVAGMERLVSTSQPGDLAVITYSGHGGTVPEYPAYKGLEAGGRTEEFIMADYAPAGPGSGAVVTNKEVKAWLSRLDRKGVDVLFVADSCFGGGMVRGVPDPRAGPPLLRVAHDVAPQGASAFRPIPMTAEELRVDVASLPHVTVLSGADRFTPVPEVFIPAPPTRRGALSYAVARALAGGAAEPGAPATTRRQLFAYARQEVQHWSDDQRIDTTPTVFSAPPGSLDRPVFSTVGEPAGGSWPPAAPAGPACPVVQLAAIHDGADARSRIADVGVPFGLADDAGRSDLVWDVAAGEVIGSAGDVVARGIGPAAIGGVIQRTAAVQCLKALAATRPQTLTLRDGVQRYAPGDTPVIEAPDVAGRHLIVFDIAADGRLQVVWPPDARDGSGTRQSAEAGPWTGRPEVIAPFGADTVVAVTSAVALPDLLDWLNAQDGRLPSAAGQVPDRLRRVQAHDETARIGTVTLYTGATP